MLQTEGLVDGVHSYNPLLTLWRGINDDNRRFQL